jgi:transposase
MMTSEFASHVGTDLHTTSLTFAVRDNTGALVKTVRMDCKCVNKIRDFLTSLPRPIHCAVESVGMYEWFWELAEPIVDRLTLVDAVGLKCKFGPRRAKTDRIDARFIAELTFKADLPTAFVPDKTTRQFRKVCRHWHATAEMLTDLKVRMRWILHQHNLPGPAHLSGDAARRWFLGHGHLLDPIAAFSFSQMLDSVEHLELQQMPIRRQIRSFSELPRYKSDIQIISTVPGIADILAAVITAETAGFQRFPDADGYACYTGLTERTEQSGDRRSLGEISCAGPSDLRWALCEAAVTLVRSDPVYRAMYCRILKNTKIKSKAKVAMARKLATWLWHMVKSGQPFIRGGSTNHTRFANSARQTARVHQTPAAA